MKEFFLFMFLVEIYLLFYVTLVHLFLLVRQFSIILPPHSTLSFPYLCDIYLFWDLYVPVFMYYKYIQINSELIVFEDKELFMKTDLFIQ